MQHPLLSDPCRAANKAPPPPPIRTIDQRCIGLSALMLSARLSDLPPALQQYAYDAGSLQSPAQLYTDYVYIIVDYIT